MINRQEKHLILVDAAKVYVWWSCIRVIVIVHFGSKNHFYFIIKCYVIQNLRQDYDPGTTVQSLTY